MKICSEAKPIIPHEISGEGRLPRTKSETPYFLSSLLVRSLAALDLGMETPDSIFSSGEAVTGHGKSLLANASNAGAAPSLLRYAAQPDVVLSQERDLYYANTLLAEGTSELAETLLGSRRVMILAPELRALASCLYFVLTNLAGEDS